MGINERESMTEKFKESAAKKDAVSVENTGNAPAAEGVSDIPSLTSPEVVEQYSSIEDFVGGAATMTDTVLATEISTFSKDASESAQRASNEVAAALVSAWACGKLLNEAKTRCGHRDFGEWRRNNLDAGVISERTSQRYMQLARHHASVKALLELSPGLRQAYIACGILPEPPEREQIEAGDAEDAKKKTLLSGVAGIQTRLRKIAILNVKLAASEKKELRSVKVEIDKFFKTILGRNQSK